MKDLKRLVEREKEVRVDKNGEVIERFVNETYVYPREDDYVKLYIERGLVMLKGISRGQAQVAFALVQRMSYAQHGQRIYVNMAMKRDIAAQLDIKPESVTQAIKYLVKADILKRIDRGCYAVNPYIFGRGDWRDVSDLRTTIDWVSGTFETHVTFNETDTENND